MHQLSIADFIGHHQQRQMHDSDTGDGGAARRNHVVADQPRPMVNDDLPTVRSFQLPDAPDAAVLSLGWESCSGPPARGPRDRLQNASPGFDMRGRYRYIPSNIKEIVQQLGRTSADHDACVRLAGVYHNLLRQWADS
jgi:PKHD-type hydroxylase C-terminal domain